MNEYFVNVTKSLDIPEFEIERLPTNTDIVCIYPIHHILFQLYEASKYSYNN